MAQGWILYGPTADLGIALTPMGVFAVVGDDTHISWVSSHPSSIPWRERYDAAAARVAAGETTWDDVLAHWVDSANGYSWALDEITLDDDVPLVQSVERAVDEILAMPIPEWNSR